jgi:hypothetical protein
MFSSQLQTRIHRDASKSKVLWPTHSGRHWLLAGCLLVMVIASQSAGVREEKRRGSTYNEYPGQHWTQVNKAEDRGWSSAKLAAAKAYADSIDTAAVVIVDDGIIVSQWGATTTKFKVHSVRKSFLNALCGIAVAKGQIDLNASLDQLGIDDNAPSLTPDEKQARVIDRSRRVQASIMPPSLSPPE